MFSSTDENCTLGRSRYRIDERSWLHCVLIYFKRWYMEKCTLSQKNSQKYGRWHLYKFEKKASVSTPRRTFVKAFRTTRSFWKISFWNLTVIWNFLGSFYAISMLRQFYDWFLFSNVQKMILAGNPYFYDQLSSRGPIPLSEKYSYLFIYGRHGKIFQIKFAARNMRNISSYKQNVDQTLPPLPIS